MNEEDKNSGPTGSLHSSASSGPQTPGEIMTARFAAMIGQAGPTSLIDRATPEQVDKMLDQAERGDIRNDAYNRSVLRYIVAVVFGLMLFLFGLCFLFLCYGAKDSMEKIVALVVGLFSGGAGGFSLGRFTSRASD